MRIKLPGYYLEVYIKVNLIRRKISTKPPTPQYTHCDVCGERIKGGTKATHMMERHPEYSFRIAQPHTSREYWCNTCNKSIGGVAAMVRHYKAEHPDVLARSNHD